jgi:hypothetical protein
MREYTFSVTVAATSEMEAVQVIAERIEHDEDYGFPYQVLGWRMEEE